MGRPAALNIDNTDVVSGNEIQSASWVARMDALESKINAIITDMLSQTDGSAQAIASAATMSGILTMGAAIALGTNKITGLGDPSAAQDAVTLAYLQANPAVLTGDDPVSVDSGSDPMLKAHAYKAQTLGMVTAWTNTNSVSAIKGYVGTTNDPAGAGVQVGENGSGSSIKSFVSFLVAKDKYFELTHSAAVVNITWTPIVAGGGNPIDQD